MTSDFDVLEKFCPWIHPFSLPANTKSSSMPKDRGANSHEGNALFTAPVVKSTSRRTELLR